MRPTDVLLLSTALALGACTATSKDGGGGSGGPGPSGDLQIQVGGLPAGTAARVTVTGPQAFNRTVTATSQLSGLPVGVYRVVAGQVSAQGQTWTGQPTPDSTTVGAGDTAAVTVTYTGGAATSLNLTVAGTQLIQSAQRADGTVPMVAGRDALLRVFVTANGANSARPTVRVRFFSGGSVVDSVDLAPTASQVPQSVDTASLAGSWNVLLPAGRVIGGLGYQVELDPGDLVAETDETDNAWPAGSTVRAVPVQNVPPLDLRFVPVTQSANNLTGRISGSNQDAFVATTRQIFPLSTVNVDVRTAFTTSAPVLTSDDNNNAWGQVLNETSALRSADGSSRHYVSIVQVTYGGGIAGLGWVGAPGSVAWDKPSSAPGVIAHEVGHNFGLRHAPCGSPSGPDPNYPYAGGEIGSWGLDLPALALKLPATHRDLMSYCSPSWISDYNYLAVLNRRGSAPAIQPASEASTEGLLVWGRIRAGRAILEPAFVVNAPARLPARSGPNRLAGYDAAGNPLFSLAFEGEEVLDLPGGAERQFVFVLPLASAERDRLASLRLTGSGLTALRSAPVAAGVASRLAGSVPEVRAVTTGAGTEIRWDGVYPMAIIRDARSGEILAFARGGTGRLPASSALRVELSDGVGSRPGKVSARPAP